MEAGGRPLFSFSRIAKNGIIPGPLRGVHDGRLRGDAMSASHELTKISESLSTGIKTDKVYRPHVPHGYRVHWIAWDSPFRRTDLRIGDLIVGVDGTPYENVDDGNVSALAIGQHGESTFWQRAGAKDGDAVTLSILRDEERLEVAGSVAADRLYFTADGKSAMGPGGPERRGRDGFQGAWATWTEDIVKKMAYILDGGWEQGSFNNKRELDQHLGHEPRIEHLLEHVPGPFAEAMAEDWRRVAEELRGRRYDLTEDDLEYRQIGEERKRIARAAADAAWAEAEAELAAVARETFPAPHPDLHEEVAGQVVILPWITQRDLINELGRSYAVVGSGSKGYYFLDAGGARLRRFFDMYFRFRGLVDPETKERYRFIARLLDEPRMLTVRRAPVTALMAEPIIGLAGDGEMFVDLRGDGPDRFAGEDKLRALSNVELGDGSDPAQVVETMIAAIKQADDTVYKQLFADWRAWARPNGETYVNRSHDLPDHMFTRPWEASRRLVSKEAYDVRVQRVSPIRTLAEDQPELGTPRIREVDVFIDHIGLVDGGYRAIANVKTRRRWTLQQLGDGPWRIVDVRSL